MTPKQINRIRTKIKIIRATLAAEKRIYGGYDDSRGLRYLPTNLYLKIGDYSGGLTYLRWFQKNFPNDCGFPDFLLEWTIILFKNKKLKEAGKKAFETFCSNTYILDKFFGRPVVSIEKNECANSENLEYMVYLNYSREQIELADFSMWLDSILSTEKFQRLSSQFTDIQKRLKNEQDSEIRTYLIRQARQLEETYE